MSTKVVNIECTGMWCRPYKPDQYGNISMEACRLSDDTRKMLTAEGIKVNFDTDNDANSPDFKGFYVKPKAPNPVVVKDTDNNVLPEKLLIGNGSKMNIGVAIKTWVNKASGKSGKKLVWLSAKVLEYVPYDPDEALRAKAEALTDGVSGGGFVFGGEDSGDEDQADNTGETTTAEARPDDDNNEEFNKLFGDN